VSMAARGTVCVEITMYVDAFKEEARAGAEMPLGLGRTVRYEPAPGEFPGALLYHIILLIVRLFNRGMSWLGDVVHANNVHSIEECSGRGECDRENGECLCFPGFEGIACERLACPNDCSGRGVCYTQKQLADAAGRVYRSPWDASKTTGWVCLGSGLLHFP
jgi:hypothetical protein